MREYNFDGLAGLTHNYAGLSRGNIASTRHAGDIGNPRAAALQGLMKMRFVASLGVPQALLPPQPRPDVATLRRLGFSGDDAAMLSAASKDGGHLLRLVSSASSMWTANAATVAPSSDTLDGRLHVTVANLSAMFHRSLEAETTTRVLRAIFSDERRFAVHEPLPPGAHFADEGAANHTRLATSRGVIHLFGWGRSSFAELATERTPQRFPARQTLEASRAVARMNELGEDRALLWQQDPTGVDAGAFHSDVLAVGNAGYFMLHERAFVDHARLLAELSARLGDELRVTLATDSELPLEEAVNAYPFNSQLVTLPSGAMAIVAPTESEASPAVRQFFDRVVAEDNPVGAVHYIDVNASMKNGGGPACLRLCVPLADDERAAIGARVFVDDALLEELESWIRRNYRDRLVADDLADPALLEECRRALDELTRILRLGSVYDFQQSHLP